MLPPKIEICIEGYNIEQTDFYIAHIIDKYNSFNELYQKSCEHIVFLEKECKNGFAASLSESEKRIIDKLSIANVSKVKVVRDGVVKEILPSEVFT